MIDLKHELKSCRIVANNSPRPEIREAWTGKVKIQEKVLRMMKSGKSDAEIIDMLRQRQSVLETSERTWAVIGELQEVQRLLTEMKE